LIELWVVISSIALLIALLPALRAARRSGRQMKAQSQRRGMHQSWVTLGPGNR